MISGFRSLLLLRHRPGVDCCRVVLQLFASMSPSQKSGEEGNKASLNWGTGEKSRIKYLREQWNIMNHFRDQKTENMFGSIFGNKGTRAIFFKRKQGNRDTPCPSPPSLLAPGGPHRCFCSFSLLTLFG